jgi:hypothetical protein
MIAVEGNMRALFVVAVAALAVVPAIAQSPVVRIANATRPTAVDFQVGDRYEITITGAAGQPVSVRTSNTQRTDWGPVIGSTDWNGQWSTAGQFEKGDFGSWSSFWTVGGKLANPVVQLAVHYSVGAPCLPGDRGMVFVSGPNVAMSCETFMGLETFTTPSLGEPFRTLDGRVVPGRNQSNMTAEEYRTGIIEYFMTSGAEPMQTGALGDQAGDLIMKLIGVNALSEGETKNLLSIVHAAFEKPESIPQAAKDPSRTLLLLQHLADSAEKESLKKQIEETMAYVQAQ